MEQVKKLSVATVFGKIKLSELVEKKVMPVMEVFGAAVAVKSGISNFGEWRSLQGTFRATNPVTRQVFQGSTLFLPEVAMIPVEVALAAGARSVEFAVRVLVRYAAEDEGHKAGGSAYEYTFESMVPPSEDDPLERMSKRLIALAAPAETAAEITRPKGK